MFHHVDCAVLTFCEMVYWCFHVPIPRRACRRSWRPSPRCCVRTGSHLFPSDVSNLLLATRRQLQVNYRNYSLDLLKMLSLVFWAKVCLRRTLFWAPTIFPNKWNFFQQILFPNVIFWTFVRTALIGFLDHIQPK